MTREVLDIDKTSLRIGKSKSWLYKNYKKLQNTKKFPAPIKGLGCFWDSYAIDLWLDLNLPSNLKLNDNAAGKNHWQNLLSQNAANL